MPWHLCMAGKLAAHGATLIFLTHPSKCDDVFRASATGAFQAEILPPVGTRGIKLVRTLARFIRDRRVDVFHMNFVRPWEAMGIMGLTKLAGRKTTFLYHKQSSGRLIHNRWNPKKYVNPLSVMSLFVDKIVCLSDAVLDNCVNRGVSRRKLVRIYNGVGTDRFVGVRDRGRIRQEYGIPSEHRIITVIKEARPETGLQDLLLSIPAVLRKCPNTTFLLVGGGEETPKLIALAESLGLGKNLIFTGVRHDIPEIVAESFFTVNPSPVEAFGNVIVESMAAGKPVIGVNAWGPKEIILNGQTGLLVEPADPTQFAPAIIELLQSPDRVEAMGKKSFDRSTNEFSLEACASRMVSLWSSYLWTSSTKAVVSAGP